MSRKFLLIMLAVLLVAFTAALVAQEKPTVKPESLVGNWELTIEAGEMVINLKLSLALENGALSGKVSESYGSFSDMPVNDLKIENSSLSFNLTVPSPPDGLTRTWTFELQVGGEELGGIVYNNDIQVSVPVRGKRIKQ
ncbi:MAG: hypothetical protein HPY46_11245 [Candidatus Aminicenantes bacterium]|nr:hypothetical protein [Candidatus Aminicenantes bacterium]